MEWDQRSSSYKRPHPSNGGRVCEEGTKERRGQQLSPHHSLLIAMLHRAVMDLRLNRSPKWRVRAWMWLNSDCDRSDVRRITFAQACDWLGLDPDHARRHIFRTLTPEKRQVLDEEVTRFCSLHTQAEIATSAKMGEAF